jgi:hypothetical protein
MRSNPSVTILARLARRPIPVFMGFVVGFAGCCIAGRLAANIQPFEHFIRFHQHIMPTNHFYPSFSHVLNLARERARTGKVLLVVGGNSIMQGAGQRESEVWTRYLQAQLGEDYEVLNLALWGNDPFEFGGLIAERLAWEGLPVILVTAALDGNLDAGSWGEWEGGAYKYFFWDAWGKGLLPPDARRDEWLNSEVTYKNPRSPSRRELRCRGFVDGLTYAGDLWNTVSYRYLATVFTDLKYPNYWEPYRNLHDRDQGDLVPFELRTRVDEIPQQLDIVRASIYCRSAQALLKGGNDETVAAPYRHFLPANLYNRTLFVFRLECMYYRELLTPTEQEQYVAIARRLPEVVGGEGLHVQVVGENYTKQDFADRTHFSEKGGRKLAADLAPSIRSIAAQLYGLSDPNSKGGKP